MHAAFSLLPLVAAILAVPQFLPQLARLRRTGETAGVSWSWAALTSVNNAAWAGYFALSGFWTALVPAISATVLAGALAVMLARRGAGFPRRPAALALAWTALLITAASLFGRAGLGTALTVAFLLQVTPSVWTAYRADHTTGIARGTWLLIFGELLCWGVFGIYESDPRLIVLGATGVAASLLVLARVARPRAPRALAAELTEDVSAAPGPRAECFGELLLRVFQFLALPSQAALIRFSLLSIPLAFPGRFARRYEAEVAGPVPGGSKAVAVTDSPAASLTGGASGGRLQLLGEGLPGVGGEGQLGASQALTEPRRMAAAPGRLAGSSC